MNAIKALKFSNDFLWKKQFIIAVYWARWNSFCEHFSRFHVARVKNICGHIQARERVEINNVNHDWLISGFSVDCTRFFGTAHLWKKLKNAFFPLFRTSVIIIFWKLTWVLTISSNIHHQKYGWIKNISFHSDKYLPICRNGKQTSNISPKSEVLTSMTFEKKKIGIKQ